MKNLLKDNFQLARKFTHTARYIHDLLTLNNTTFENEITNIYPPELELKKTTEGTDYLSYLDITISIKNGKYVTTLYDKRDAFNFHIVNFPYLDSNIPAKPAYGTYISQLVRIGRICGDFITFASRNHTLTTRSIRQGFWYTKLCAAFKKFSHRHAEIFHKFKASTKLHNAAGIGLPLGIVGTLARNVSTR